MENINHNKVDGTETLLERYLAGAEPLEPERLALPTDDELDAAEAEFDRIVAARKPQRRTLLRWWPLAAAAAAVLAVVMVLEQVQVESPEVVAVAPPSVPEGTSIALLPEDNSIVSPSEDEKVASTSTPEKPFQPNTQPTKVTAPSLARPARTLDPSRTGRAGGESSSSSSPDSLRYYLARLEAEMQAVDDSVVRQHLEQLIATDAHLQQLVQRIVHAEAETAMNPTPADSTDNYLNF